MRRTDLIAIASVVFIAAVGWYSLRRGNPDPPRPEGTIIDDWAQLADGGHSVGASNGSLKLVAFLNYECRYCGAAQDVLDELLQRENDQLSITIRHFPVSPNSRVAAVAAECAGLQGRFWDYHRQLFRAREAVLDSRWTELATAASVADIERFLSCVRDTVTVATVDRDLVLGRDLGIRATPTFVINGYWAVGHRPVVAFDSIFAIVRQIGARRR